MTTVEPTSAESRQLAAELADIVAHAVMALAVCAGAAHRQLLADPTGARHSLATVRELAEQVMPELRRLQLVLHQGPPDYAPQPSLDDLARLIDVAAARGLTVRWSCDGDGRAVSPSVAATIHRIVEVALAARTAADADVEVGVVVGGASLNLRIAPALRLGADPVMERVRLLGGRLRRSSPDALVVELPR